jgi:hypothetical protein
MEKAFKNIKDFFSNLSFQEDIHKYFVDGIQLTHSVSGLIDKYKNKFDTHNISEAVAKKENTTGGEIRLKWKKIADDACQLGTATHLFGELYPFNRELKPSSKFEEAIVKFWNDLPDFLIPAILEVQMYHKTYMFGGTADILLYNTKTGKYILGDYKTNKDLFNVFGNQKLKLSMSNLADNNFNKYQIQLSLYQILLEQSGIEISQRKLIWLKPDGEYEMYNCEDYTDLIKEDLKIIYENR